MALFGRSEVARPSALGGSPEPSPFVFGSQVRLRRKADSVPSSAGEIRLLSCRTASPAAQPRLDLRRTPSNGVRPQQKGPRERILSPIHPPPQCDSVVNNVL